VAGLKASEGLLSPEGLPGATSVRFPNEILEICTKIVVAVRATKARAELFAGNSRKEFVIESSRIYVFSHQVMQRGAGEERLESDIAPRRP
jgi:hypothetical protein